MKKYVILLALLSILTVAACTGSTQSAPSTQSSDAANDLQSTPTAPGDTDTQSSTQAASLPLWMTAELKDVRTQETFTIADFAGTPVLVESFGVWCPICTAQQQQTKILHEEVGDDIITVNLDTDQNEDEARVLGHVTKNGFNWRYVVTPIEVTNSLRADFGPIIVNVPTIPIILVCPDQTVRKLPGGVKSPDKLKEEVAKGCAA